jgi:hypothetical protein
LTTNVCDDLLCSTNGDYFYVQCTKSHGFVITFSINKPLFRSTQLHPKTYGALCGQFFNPCIILKFENFDLKKNASTFESIANPNY